MRDHQKRRAEFLDSLPIGEVSLLESLPEKFGFHLPEEGFDQRLRFLEADDLRDMATHLVDDSTPLPINRMIIAREEAESSNQPKSQISELREKFLKEFEGTVFRDKVVPDPPVRGQYGYAFIPLKEGAVPTRAKQLFMHGEL